MANGGKKVKVAASIPYDTSIIMHGTSNDPVGLESWRPNMHIFRPQDYWRGSVDYVPWKSGDDDNDDVHNPKAVQMMAKGAEQGQDVEVELEAVPGTAGRRKGGGTGASVASINPSTCSFVAFARVDTMEGGGNVEGAEFSGQVELGIGVSAKQLSTGAVVMGGKDEDEGESGAGSGVKCAADKSTSLASGEVETALHSVLDALGKVKAERLRLTTRLARTPQLDG